MQPKQDFLHAEGLRHVIVPARGQTYDPVLDGVLGGKEESRYLRREGADPAQQLNAVEPWQHHVQHQDVRPELLCKLDSFRPVGGDGNGPAGHTKAHAHEFGEAGFVVHHQRSDGGAVRVRQLRKVIGHGVRSGH